VRGTASNGRSYRELTPRDSRNVAAAVELTDTQHFTAKRRAIRVALIADGVAAEMEAMADAILPP
jgi:hypothetical protein